MSLVSTPTEIPWRNPVPPWETENTSTPSRGTASPALPWMGWQRPCVMWLPCILVWGLRGQHHQAQVSAHQVWTVTVRSGDPCCVLGSPWHSRLHSQLQFGLLSCDFIIVITIGLTWLFLVNSCNVSNWFMILGRKKWTVEVVKLKHCWSAALWLLSWMAALAEQEGSFVKLPLCQFLKIFINRTTVSLAHWLAANFCTVWDVWRTSS